MVLLLVADDIQQVALYHSLKEMSGSASIYVAVFASWADLPMQWLSVKHRKRSPNHVAVCHLLSTERSRFASHFNRDRFLVHTKHFCPLLPFLSPK